MKEIGSTEISRNYATNATLLLPPVITRLRNLISMVVGSNWNRFGRSLSSHCLLLITTCRASGENKNTRRGFCSAARWVRTILVRPFNRDVHLYNQGREGGGEARRKGGKARWRVKKKKKEKENNCERSDGEITELRVRKNRAISLLCPDRTMLLPSPRVLFINPRKPPSTFFTTANCDQAAFRTSADVGRHVEAD